MILKRTKNSRHPLSISRAVLVGMVIFLLMNEINFFPNFNQMHWLYYGAGVTNLPPLTNVCTPGKIIASLVVFGVPKSFHIIWRSYVRNIIDRNPDIDFEVHMHMYADLSVIFTPRNGELNATLDTPVTIRSILKSEGNIPIYFTTSSQNEYDMSLVSWLGKDTLYDYDVHTTMNIFRQGNSMKEAYLSASGKDHLNLTSKERGSRCENNTMYVFLRSDTLLISPIDIPKQGIGGMDVYMPMWQAWPGHAYNDRFAVAGSFAATVYASAKSYGFQQMILEQRNKNESLQLLGTPERMLKHYLDKHNLNITLIPDWAKLLRIRGGGGMNDRDISTFGLKVNKVEDLSFAWTPL
ncbi:hypothetical protein ACHAW6_001480 [Cyclotella cf. meneghiniana]